MKIETAKFILNQCERHEARDHAFGDMEVYWTYKGASIADGYFGGGHASVSVTPQSQWSGAEAHELLKCGKTVSFSRNDETGPDNFQLGATMPGLTLDSVRKELTS